MTAPVRITWGAAAQAEVARRFEATREAETRLRYQMVLLAGEGRTAAQVARLVRRSHDTVLRVLRRYQARRPRGGTSPGDTSPADRERTHTMRHCTRPRPRTPGAAWIPGGHACA